MMGADWKQVQALHAEIRRLRADDEWTKAAYADVLERAKVAVGGDPVILESFHLQGAFAR